jgi:hypothetical protein
LRGRTYQLPRTRSRVARLPWRVVSRPQLEKHGEYRILSPAVFPGHAGRTRNRRPDSGGFSLILLPEPCRQMAMTCICQTDILDNALLPVSSCSAERIRIAVADSSGANGHESQGTDHFRIVDHPAFPPLPNACQARQVAQSIYAGHHWRSQLSSAVWIQKDDTFPEAFLQPPACPKLKIFAGHRHRSSTLPPGIVEITSGYSRNHATCSESAFYGLNLCYRQPLICAR